MARFVKVALAIAAVIVVALGGGYMLMRRADIPYPALEARYASQSSKYIDLPSGVRAHYRVQGNPAGRTILLIHGFGVSLETWEPWVAQLGGVYRLVTVDLPGHGLTRAPDAFDPTITAFSGFIDEFAAAAALPRFTIVGAAMGGNVAWFYALHHPDRVDALVLIDAGGWRRVGPHGDRPLVFAMMSNRFLAPVLANLDPAPLVRGGLEAAFVDKTLVTDAVVDRYATLARAPGHRRILQAIELNRSKDGAASTAALAALKAPTLILWGGADALNPPGNAARFAEAIPGATLISYPGVGNLPHEEVAARSAADLRRFIDARTLAGAALIGPTRRAPTKPAPQGQ